MNASFETIRKELKKYNAEDNEAPPKLVIADSNDFLSIDYKKKRNSQFIIAVKEFSNSEENLIEKFITDVGKKSGQRPLVFFYDERCVIEDVIKDFEDYYNKPIDRNVFQPLGTATVENESRFCLIIVVLDNYYYNS